MRVFKHQVVVSGDHRELSREVGVPPGPPGPTSKVAATRGAPRPLQEPPGGSLLSRRQEEALGSQDIWAPSLPSPSRAPQLCQAAPSGGARPGHPGGVQLTDGLARSILASTAQANGRGRTRSPLVSGSKAGSGLEQNSWESTFIRGRAPGCGHDWGEGGHFDRLYRPFLLILPTLPG